MGDSWEGCICEDQYGEWLRDPIAKGIRRGGSVQTDQVKRTKTLKLRSGEEQGHNEVKGVELRHQESNQLE